MSYKSKILIIECPSCKEESFIVSESPPNNYYQEIWSDGVFHDSFWYTPIDHFLSRCHCGRFIWLFKVKPIVEFDFDITTKNSDAKYKKYRRGSNYLSMDDYLDAISMGFPENIKEEMYLRLKAWRESNDSFRREVHYYEWDEESSLQFYKARTERKIALFKKIEKSKDVNEKNDLLKQISGIDSEYYMRKSTKHYDIMPQIRSELTKQNMEIIAEKLGNNRESELLMKAEILRELEFFDDSIKILQNRKVREYLPDFSRKIERLSKNKDQRIAKIEMNDLSYDPFYVSPGILFPGIEAAPSRNMWQ